MAVATVDPLAGFTNRDQETVDRISLIIDRGCTLPSPYHSYAEWNRDLAAAYEQRAAFWQDVMDAGGGSGVVFSAVLDARTRCREHARDLRSEARRAAREDAERAWRSYEPNLRAVA